MIREPRAHSDRHEHVPHPTRHDAVADGVRRRTSHDRHDRQLDRYAEGENPNAFNPFDPSETQHMWDLAKRLRQEQPVSRPMPGFVYLASHADNKAVYRDAKRFSSGEGFRAEGVVVPDEESFLGEIDSAPAPQGASPAHPRVHRPGGERGGAVDPRHGARHARPGARGGRR